MQRHYLTTRFLNSLKPTTRTTTVSDEPSRGGEPGLKVRVLPSGRKVFTWRRAQGTDRLMRTLGEFPSMSVV